MSCVGCCLLLVNLPICSVRFVEWLAALAQHKLQVLFAMLKPLPTGSTNLAATVSNPLFQSLTYQIAIQVDDLKHGVAAGNIGEQPDGLLVLISDAHSSEVDL